MVDVVKQIDILNQIGIMLKAEFKSTVYSDEILEDFAKPCFFIKCLFTNIPQTKNITKKDCPLSQRISPEMPIKMKSIMLMLWIGFRRFFRGEYL